MPGRILIIEDNKTNLQLMSYLVTSFGYELETVMDGETALERVGQQTFDLIVCDIQLPGISGYDVVRHLKEDPRHCTIPIVSVSALAMVGDREQIMAAGFDGYIAKPIVPERFVAELEEFLPASVRAETRTGSQSWPEAQTLTVACDHKGTVLVVDDNADNRAVLASVLQPSGYAVVMAATGEEAFAILQEQRPDLILTDLHLGAEPVFTLLRRVKEDPILRSIPVVYISSTTRAERLRTEALDRGAVQFIFRPVEPEVLLAEVETCLSPH